ncbi:MAG: alpha/beta hydrolase [Deltaproteobacteria bacterium]|nr:alpha/beta hydrolase [Deltaproteobacteria bacterium]MBN2674475.1 alpha/beta hydrolase [Deltaproteobacteria bacterium]
MTRILLSTLAAVGGGYLLICTAVYMFQNRMVYHPLAELTQTPSDWGIPYENVHFQADDGVRLNGWFLPGRSGAPTVLFCHGNAGNMSGREAILTILHELGAAVFIFDYRGYGNSEGSPSEIGTVLDVQAAWRVLTEERGIAPNDIILFGRSLGGGVASHLASSVQCRGLVLMSTFTSLPQVGQQAYPFLPIKLLSRYEYPNQRIIRSLRIPVLIFHGKGDEVIPYAHGRSLWLSAHPPKRFVELKGGHNDAVIASQIEIKTALRVFLYER